MLYILPPPSAPSPPSPWASILCGGNGGGGASGGSAAAASGNAPPGRTGGTGGGTTTAGPEVVAGVVHRAGAYWIAKANARRPNSLRLPPRAPKPRDASASNTQSSSLCCRFTLLAPAVADGHDFRAEATDP
ncbi:Protein of unknown function [Gryllus bimaculatus]|nr:Protein of unknown function [Gryllus bimaculatus]